MARCSYIPCINKIDKKFEIHLYRTTAAETFKTLLYRSGLSRQRITAAFHPTNFESQHLKKVYTEAIENCCLLNRGEVLADFASYVNSCKSEGDSEDEVRFMDVAVDISCFFPLDIILNFAQPLFRAGLLYLLPSLVQTVINAVSVTDSPLSVFMLEGIKLLDSADEQLKTDGYEALFETTRILVIAGCDDEYDEDEGTFHGLRSIIQSSADWEQYAASSVKSIRCYFQFIVRLVELYIEHEARTDSVYTAVIISAAEKLIEKYEGMISTSEINTHRKHIVRLNAVMDGLADVFRCFLLARSHACCITLHKHDLDGDYEQLPQLIVSAFIALNRYSSSRGHSGRLFQMLLDGVCSADAKELKRALMAEIKDVPAGSSKDFRSTRDEAVECLGKANSPRSLQYLTRQVIHQKLWDTDPDGVIHQDSFSSFGLPIPVLDYCMFG